MWTLHELNMGLWIFSPSSKQPPTPKVLFVSSAFSTNDRRFCYSFRRPTTPATLNICLESKTYQCFSVNKDCHGIDILNAPSWKWQESNLLSPKATDLQSVLTLQLQRTSIKLLSKMTRTLPSASRRHASITPLDKSRRQTGRFVDNYWLNSRIAVPRSLFIVQSPNSNQPCSCVGLEGLEPSTFRL